MFEALILYFFFSSRRRHTRWPRDWSSDVCSSDLSMRLAFPGLETARVCELAAPTVTAGKLREAGRIAICGCTPTPVSVAVAGELAASLTTEKAPVELPAVVGL